MAVSFGPNDVPTPNQDDVDFTLQQDLADEINGSSMASGDVAVFNLADYHRFPSIARIMWVEVRNETTGTTVTIEPAKGSPDIPAGFGLPWAWDHGTDMIRFAVDGAVASGDVSVKMGIASDGQKDKPAIPVRDVARGRG